MRPHRHDVFTALLAIVAVLRLVPAGVSAAPATEGLVLWLDAADPTGVACDAAGQVSRWADRSGREIHARQDDPARRPQFVPDALGGKPVLRFGNGAHLNLGRPESLDFRPGQPFTLAAAYRVASKSSGTFIAKGGGPAAQRAYQFYVAPGRQGAIAYGVMRENPRTGEAGVALAVCDGAKTEVFLNGLAAFSFAVGKGASDVDVLIGARRQNDDNTGIEYPLAGDLAELLVYDRALDRRELDDVGRYLKEKYALDSDYVDPADVGKLVALLATPDAYARLDMLAESLARQADRAAPELRALVEGDPAAASAAAELLLRIAHNNALSAELAAVAAGWLDARDPFVCAMAEWALAMKVGNENNGQDVVWPGAESPDWFPKWHEAAATGSVEADWVRQAVSLRIHRDRDRLIESVDAMIDRVGAMTAGYEGPRFSRQARAEVARRTASLAAIRGRLAEADSSDLTGCRQLWIEARRALRAVVLANPVIDFDRLIFVKQFAPHTVRNITRSYAWKHKPGGDLCILSDLGKSNRVEPVLAGRLGPGYVWGLDLWWDADRVVFAYARQPNWPPDVDTTDATTEGRHVLRLRTVHEPLHLFEVGVDGSDLTQLTDDPYWSDFEPTYCANGDVVFSSDRCGRSAECGNDTYDHTNPNLYIRSSDGTIRQLTDSKDIDRYPHSLDDGRIAYTHWEYQERHFMEVHALWTLRPDGTMSDALFKHHMRAPCGLRDTRSIAGSAKLVSIATGHHTFAYGPVVIVDPAHGMNNEAGLAIVTPGVKPQEGPMAGRPVPEGGVPDRGGLYQTPWALSETCFLVSYAYDRPKCTAPAGVDANGFGLYLIDVYGNRELLCRDPLLSCTFPIPLRRRPRPPRVPDVRGEPAPYATCYVPDVYDGMDGVPRGTIKYLRIAQHVAWPFDPQRGQMDYIPGNAGTRRIDFQSWSPVRVIGEVPVERDGSAHFLVPADAAIYFQALDERHMEVRRMRSMVSLKAGEVRGCAGCHETRAASPHAATPLATALQRAPDVPAPPPWGSQTMLGYESLVQPILDRRCVECHGSDQPEGGLDFTATRAPDGLLQSYRTMFGRLPGRKEPGAVLVSCSDRFSNADVTQPKQFGSHRSRLTQVLLDDAHKTAVALSPSEWYTLVTWVDANAPYYDAFLNKRPDRGNEPVREILAELPGLGDRAE